MLKGRLPLDLPPLWLVAFLALAWGLSRAVPIAPFDWPAGVEIGWGLVVAALALALWSAAAFHRARTSIIPGQTADALVTDGPYRWSRNPIYLADVVILAAASLILGALWPILLAPGFVWVLERRFIRPEEAMLRERFPEAFQEWSRRTRRWI